MSNSAQTLTTTVGTRMRAKASESSASLNTSHARGDVLEIDRRGLRGIYVVFAQLLADTITISDLYTKHAEQSSGPNARVFQLICERHCVEHVRLAELLSAQVRALGGDAIVMAGDIADASLIPRPPRRGETLEMQVQRLLNAHEIIAEQAIAILTSLDIATLNGLASREAVLVASELILTGKLHVWLLAEHLSNVSQTSQVATHMACITGRLVLPFC